ncbi:MAG: cytidylate kinase family protein [bacterium]
MSIITISRGTFSGGQAIAEYLAKRLDYPCVSREVIQDAARASGDSPEELASAMKEAPPFWQQVPTKRMRYLNYVCSALLERAQGGKLIYHGHAGHLLLVGISHVIRVRVIADPEFRIASAMERHRLGRPEAIAHIHKMDEERIRWTRFLYGKEWQDPALYDVTLNLERMGIAAAGEVVARMTELEEFQPTEESRAALEDLLISTRVWAAINRDESTRGANVRVTARRGTVTVSGSVGSEKALEAVPLVARRVAGVKQVRCEAGMGSDWYW